MVYRITFILVPSLHVYPYQVLCQLYTIGYVDVILAEVHQYTVVLRTVTFTHL